MFFVRGNDDYRTKAGSQTFPDVLQFVINGVGNGDLAGDFLSIVLKGDIDLPDTAEDLFFRLARKPFFSAIRLTRFCRY